jgi:hypothetical protein
MLNSGIKITKEDKGLMSSKELTFDERRKYLETMKPTLQRGESKKNIKASC